MSAEILAAPDSSFNVRFTRRENRGEGEEMEVEILEDEEHHADLGSQQARPNTEKNRAAVRRRCFRAPAVTLGVMYLLILAGIYIRYILVTLEKDQLQTRYDTLSNNYTQLQETVSNITANISQLQDEVKKLKDEIKGFGHQDYQLLHGASTQHAAINKDNGDKVDIMIRNSSFNVRFTRRENRGEGEEMEVEILEDEEHHADLGSQQANILVTMEKDQLQTRYDNLSNNYTQLQETVSVNISQLQDEVKKLRSKIKGEKN
ncbi:uncharacterized protein [Pagrus major]|uniref:uncharacterized protein n=1 Tax=Pagrus major TaxID=143350 RepID=UPI003CC84758